MRASVEISISSQSEIVIKDFLAWILPKLMFYEYII